jgi:RHS repeat-associated protein
VHAGGRIVALAETVGSTTTMKYFHGDHLASTSVVTDASGNVIERLSYDAWGKRRSVTGADASISAQHNRGFTGHEHLDAVNFIHMNGRVYDPTLARFISADPFIQSPENSQSYNRYSYVLNNPLTLVDPSGYGSLNPFKLVRNIVHGVQDVLRDSNVRTVIGIGVGIWLGVGDFSWLYNSCIGPGIFGPGLASAFPAGFAGAAIATGDLDGALRGGLTAGAFNIVGGIGAAEGWASGELALAHAVVGCASSAAGGESCRSGALSAGVAKYATMEWTGNLDPVGKGIAVSVIGGTASVSGGGKFANGAITAGFAYLFNELQTRGRAGEMARRLRAQSPDLDALLTQMEKSADLYVIGDAPIPADQGGGQTNLYPGLKGRVIIDMRVSGEPTTFIDASGQPFVAPAERILLHEIGHGATYLNGGRTGFRYDYDRAIHWENRLFRGLDPTAPIRHPTQGHQRRGPF